MTPNDKTTDEVVDMDEQSKADAEDIIEDDNDTDDDDIIDDDDDDDSESD